MRLISGFCRVPSMLVFEKPKTATIAYTAVALMMSETHSRLADSSQISEVQEYIPLACHALSLSPHSNHTADLERPRPPPRRLRLRRRLGLRERFTSASEARCKLQGSQNQTTFVPLGPVPDPKSPRSQPEELQFTTRQAHLSCSKAACSNVRSRGQVLARLHALLAALRLLDVERDPAPAPCAPSSTLERDPKSLRS